MYTTSTSGTSSGNGNQIGKYCLSSSGTELLEDISDRDKVKANDENYEEPCLHDSCPECHGTGRKAGGGMCIHGIACPCPKCSPRF